MNAYGNCIASILGVTLLNLFGGGESAIYAATTKNDFPLIMSMNIGSKHYDDPTYLAALSRPNVVVLGFYPGWRGRDRNTQMPAVVQALKQRNPRILVGQYTILSETQDSSDHASADTDKGKKLDEEGWWLKNAKRNRVQWTDKYHAFETNITQWTKPDKNGLRYPEWLAVRDYEIYFKPEVGFDIWYFDNSLSKPAVKSADWNGDGRNDSNDDPEIVKAHRQGHVAQWQHALRLRPDILLMGNATELSSGEFSGKLHGAFLEALIGAAWSIERWQGWEAMMERYHSAMKHTAEPHIVGFNVHGKKDDYQRMRYGLASCLLDNGYFSYTDERVGYGSVPWFDEYEVDLGMPVEPPINTPRPDGVYSRKFQRGLVLVNPGLLPKIVVTGVGYRRIKGEQDPNVNDGTRVTSITLNGKDGVILLKEGI